LRPPVHPDAVVAKAVIMPHGDVSKNRGSPTLARDGPQILEHLGGVSRRRDLRVDLVDLPLAVDEKRHAPGISGYPSDTVGSKGLAAGIAQHGVRQCEAFDEPALGLGSIGADSDDLGAESADLLDGIAEPASFDRSTRGRGLRKKEQHDGAASEIAERESLASGGLEREVRCGLPCRG
jgi:hypothetical protein